jgi:hypothetical protein
LSGDNHSDALPFPVAYASGSFSNGPWCQAGPVILPLVTCFCPWSAKCCHIIPSEAVHICD